MVNAASGNVSIIFQITAPTPPWQPPVPPAPTPSATPAGIIQYDMADVMIAGGSEAALCELGMASFLAAALFPRAMTIPTMPAGHGIGTATDLSWAKGPAS